jgi:DTW domain-containing protein YfiP
MLAPMKPLSAHRPDHSDRPRRPHCPVCLRPQATCICRSIAPLATRASLLILQHPLETANAKGSARLLHLCLPGSALVAGEQFEPAALGALLHAEGRRPLLLYPGAPDDAAAPEAAPEQLRLVVLDATWRKSRKMLHLNPMLAALPRLSLRAMPASHYRIRKAHAPDQLSCFEAAAYGLMQLERDAGGDGLARLLAAFDSFVDQQAGYSAQGGPPAAYPPAK